MVETFCAGSRLLGRVNSKVVEPMKEVGYGMTAHCSKDSVLSHGKEVDDAVTMGCGGECPLVLARWREDWQIPGPRDEACPLPRRP
ncbi:MAG: hypothetical protein U0744_05755 [Gemmataceae bacterium]